MTTTKQCSRCKEVKSAEAFAKSKKPKDGLQQRCRACQAEYHLTVTLARKPPRECTVCHQSLPVTCFRRCFRVGTKDVCLECEKTWLRCPTCKEVKRHEDYSTAASNSTGRHSQCRSCALAHQNESYRTTDQGDKRRKYSREYAQKPENREKRLAYLRAYFATDQGKAAIRKYAHSLKGYIARTRRRAKMAQVECTLTWQEWVEILEANRYRCYYCHREFGPRRKPEQDHKTAVSKGGGHTKENVVPACRYCNASKNDRDAPVTLPDGSFWVKEVS